MDVTGCCDRLFFEDNQEASIQCQLKDIADQIRCRHGALKYCSRKMARAVREAEEAGVEVEEEYKLMVVELRGAELLAMKPFDEEEQRVADEWRARMKRRREEEHDTVVFKRCRNSILAYMTSFDDEDDLDEDEDEDDDDDNDDNDNDNDDEDDEEPEVDEYEEKEYGVDEEEEEEEEEILEIYD